jgi:MFS family permease
MNPHVDSDAVVAADAIPPAAQPAAPRPQPVPDADPPYPPVAYSWYVVGLLMVVYVFSFMDRQILALLVTPIKRDLNLTDTQMSYLMGLSFAVFYTFFGIPLGRLADTMSRRGLIAAGLFFWSLMTTGCGFAQRFWQLALMRMGVGIGEATLSPSAYSLISDSFPRHLLGRAISIYGAGIYIGSGLAYLLGGVVVRWLGQQPTVGLPLVGDVRSWQVVFFVLGIPGMLLTLALLTVKEPARRGARRTSAGGRAKVEQVPLGQVVGYMKQSWATFFCHNMGYALLSLSSYGTTAWIAEFIKRTYPGWTQADAGIAYGILVIVFGTAGIVFGGWLADRMGASGVEASKMWVGALASALWFVTGLFYTLAPSAELALTLLAPAVFFAAMPMGIAAAAIQEMMPNTMRGQASAIYLFVVNLIGLGIGPSAVAWVTDYWFGDENMLRYSLLIVNVTAHVAATALLVAGVRHFKQSLRQLEAWNAGQN